MGKQYIYTIYIPSLGVYVGKASNNSSGVSTSISTNTVLKHFALACPFPYPGKPQTNSKDKHQSAFEKDLAQLIRMYGFNNCFAFTQCGRMPISEVKSLLHIPSSKFTIRGGEQVSFLTLLQRLLGYKDALSVIEAILITLQYYKNGDSINKQIDRVGMLTEWSSLEDFWSVQTLKDRWASIGEDEMSLWLTPSVEKFAQVEEGLNQGVTNWINQWLQNTHITTAGVLAVEKVNLWEHKQWARAWSAAISGNTKDDLIKQLKAKIKKTETKAAAARYRKLIRDIKDGNFTTYNEVFKVLEESALKNRKYHISHPLLTEDKLQDFVQELHNWLHSISPSIINTILNTQGQELHQTINSWYRDTFTAFIQNDILNKDMNGGNRPLFDSEFMDWQYQKSETTKQIDHGGQNYQWFYIKYASTELHQDLPSLYQQTKQQIEKYDLPYVVANWHDIYREQVSYWLKDKDDIGRYANYHRFLHLTNTNEMKCY